MTQTKMVVTFAVCGLAVAILLAAIRIYVLYQYHDVVEDWFNTLTLILWPSAFYLTVMQAKATPTVAAIVWGIAICANAPIYALIGWIAWSFGRLLRVKS